MLRDGIIDINVLGIVQKCSTLGPPPFPHVLAKSYTKTSVCFQMLVLRDTVNYKNAKHDLLFIIEFNSSIWYRIPNWFKTTPSYMGGNLFQQIVTKYKISHTL